MKNCERWLRSHLFAITERGTMEEQISFKERVRKQIIESAKIYQSYYVDYEYLVCSSELKQKPYYILKSNGDNFLHLTGVYTELKAEEFYEKAFNGTLSEDDFEVEYGETTEKKKSSKGTIRRKINALPYIGSLFTTDSVMEEEYSKNKIHCSFATSESNITMGFVELKGNARPKTLLKGNGLNNNKVVAIENVFRRKTGTDKFNEVILGDVASLRVQSAKELLDNSLLKEDNK